MKKTPLYDFCHRALWIIACLVSVIIFSLNIIYNAEVSYDESELVSISCHLIPSAVMLAVAVLLVFLGSRFRGVIGQVNERGLFLVLSGIYSFMAAYLLLHIDYVLRADAGCVFSAAQSFLRGDFRDFATDGYLHRYPQQAGLMLYDALLTGVFKSPAVLFIMNFFFVIGINYLSYKISDHLFHNKAVNILTILFSFAFLPQFFFILFAYGTVPGLFCMILAFYNALKFSTGTKTGNLVGMVISSAAAVIFKMNYLIGVIAIVIFLILKLLKREGSGKHLIAVTALVLCMVLPSGFITACLERITGSDLNQGTPSILWIAMGTDIDNQVRAPGWYDGSNYILYNRSEHNSEAASELGKAKLLDNLKKIQDDPRKAADFFTRKTISLWCEPMYQALWSGPLEDNNQFTHTGLLKSLYNNGLAEDVTAAFSKFLTLLLWGFASLFLILNRKRCINWEPMFLFVIGGVLFHTMWEGKSQYIYPYVFSLIPFAMYALWQVANHLTSLRKKNTYEK